MSLPIKHITPKSKTIFLKRRKQIVSFYNKTNHQHMEDPNINLKSLRDTSLLHCFYSEQALGGLLVEQILGNKHLAIITFAAIEPDKCNQGIMTQIIRYAMDELAKVGCSLVGVQMNLGDDPAFWNKQGFVHSVPFMNGYALMLNGY
ncbi:GNAT family N-acetyltransferase [Vibrio anguillarum]|uniref:GNAT family N-acetyltransferase n=3 Tax=Vibrio anguillarum TaxID=55601 RepID=A0ABR9Z7Y5_VIBAN|nr:GNAT family N-acetyltransferase [Vibrio anguillarum]